MAEEHLRSHSIPAAAWPGSRFRYTQNLEDSMWASVCVEIERRGGEWLVTRLDRRREPAPGPDTGFRILST